MTSSSSHRAHQKIQVPSGVGAVVSAFSNAVGKRFSLSQEKHGDAQLKRASDLVSNEIRSMAAEDDLKVIGNKITL